MNTLHALFACFKGSVRPSLLARASGFVFIAVVVVFGLVSNISYANTYATWKTEVFTSTDQANSSVSGETANPSGDGINNLEKYAFGLNPYQSVTAGLPTLSYALQSGQTYPTLTYQVPAVDPPTDLLYIPQASASLTAGWQQGASVISLLSTSGPTNGLNFFTYIATGLPLSSNATAAVRLQIAETVVISLASGSYTSSQTASITGPTGAAIYYTTDGSTPTNAKTLYTSPLTISASQTLKVQAYVGGIAYGGVAVAQYTIQATLLPPVITSAATANANAGTGFVYNILATHNATSFSVTGALPGLNVNTTTGVISGTPPSPGVYTVTLGATNSAGTGTQTLTLTVNPAIPIINSATSASGTAGIPFTYTITALNAATSFSASGLPTGLSVNATTGVIAGTPKTYGTSTVTLGASNAGGASIPVVLTLTLGNPPAPVITSGTTATGDNGVAFSYTITASNNPTSFSASGLPSGLSVNTSTGMISGTPTSTGTSTVTLGASNAGSSAATPVTLTLTIASATAPVITSALTTVGQYNITFTYHIAATNSPISYNATGLPAGLTVSTSTGLISGTPSSSTTGTVLATISATNSAGTGSATLVFNMNPAAPVITSATSASGSVGAIFNYLITASNGATSFNATDLPSGLSVNTTTGAITGTPTAAGSATIALSATNAGGTGTATLNLTVNLPQAVPVITSGATATGDIGVPFTYYITTSPLLPSPTGYSATGLPAWASINTATGLISGTPTTPTGTSTVMVSATNAGGTSTLALTLSVNSATAPVITSASTYSGTQNIALVQYSITATNSPTSYTASGLPPGLSVNATSGAITGMPTATGTSTITLTATNTAGTGTASLTLTINPPAPVINSVSTASGSFGVAISSYTITATNNPTSFSASGSPLPPGLILNSSSGVITGTPTASGVFSTTINATNAGGTGSATLTFTIGALSTSSPPNITKSVAIGDYHSILLKSDGTVWAAGSDGSGELGNNGDITTVSYVKVSGLPSGIVEVAAGAGYSAALANDGTVWTWGTGSQLGNGLNGTSITPIHVSGPTGITAIAAGDTFVLALENDGTVWAWGNNFYGQLGNGSYNDGSPVSPIHLTTISNVVSVAAGSSYAVAAKSDGTVWAWGANYNDQIGVDSNTAYESDVPLQVAGVSGITAVTAGSDFSVALKNDGTVWAWGDNDGGWLGNGATGGNNPTPVQVSKLSDVVGINSGGGDHTLALRNDGTVWAWGSNDYGQLGNQTTMDSNVPVLVSNLAGVASISAGEYGQNLVVESDGSVWAWGYNVNDSDTGAGNLGPQMALPGAVENLNAIVSVASAKGHYLGVKSDGTVWTWGDTTPGKVGDGIDFIGSNSAVQVLGLSGITKVACGTYFNYALKSDGTVWAWGQNVDGELGDGTYTDRQIPQQIPGLSNITVIATSTGHFGVALDSSGHVWTWGYNGDGELGNGNASIITSNTPAQISSISLSGITAISAGSSRAYALKNDGTLWAWGGNFFGDLGNGNATTYVPYQISGLSGVTAVTAGYYHTVILKSDGTVWAWGENQVGQLGNGLVTNSTSPVQVSGLTGITKIASGEDSFHTVALKSDGTLWSWGSNSNGQFGVGTYGSISGSNSTPSGSDVPVQVLGLNGATVTGLACGKSSTMVLKSDGTVLEWGDESYEPIGFSIPVHIANLQPNSAPLISPAGGAYPSSQTISITTTMAGTIHYTLDGTEPNVNSPTYSSFTLSSDAMVSAAVFTSGNLVSSVASSQFYISDSTKTGLPTAVTGLIVTPNPNSNSEIDLSWTLGGTVNYNEIGVYRVSGGNTTLVAILSPSTTSYKDTSVLGGTNYQYYVATLNSSGATPTATSSTYAPTPTNTVTITVTAPTGTGDGNLP